MSPVDTVKFSDYCSDLPPLDKRGKITNEIHDLLRSAPTSVKQRYPLPILGARGRFEEIAVEL